MQLLNFINVRSELQDKYATGNESKYGVIYGPYFPVFGLNTKIYSVNLRIQSEYRKIQARNNSVFGQFPTVVCLY